MIDYLYLRIYYGNAKRKRSLMRGTPSLDVFWGLVSHETGK